MPRLPSSSTSDLMASGSGFSVTRSSTTGRPAKKPGEFSVHPSSACSHSSSGASGASAKARKERAGKRIDFLCTGAARSFRIRAALVKGGVLTDLLILLPIWLTDRKLRGAGGAHIRHVGHPLRPGNFDPLTLRHGP